MRNIADTEAGGGRAFLKSREKFLEDIRKIHGESTDDLENLFLAYFPVAVVSELQNKNHIKDSEKKVVKISGDFVEKTSEDGDALKSAKEKAPTCEKAIFFFESAVIVFGKIKWNSGFGGKQWEQIAKTALMRLKGEIDPVTFIDTAFNIQHHNGHIFDKHENLDCDDEKLNSILSIKRDSSLPKMKKLTKKYASNYIEKLFARGKQFDWWQEEENGK